MANLVSKDSKNCNLSTTYINFHQSVHFFNRSSIDLHSQSSPSIKTIARQSSLEIPYNPRYPNFKPSLSVAEKCCQTLCKSLNALCLCHSSGCNLGLNLDQFLTCCNHVPLQLKGFFKEVLHPTPRILIIHLVLVLQTMCKQNIVAILYN